MGKKDTKAKAYLEDNTHRREREYGNADSFLSGFQKHDRLTPVITLMLYLGNKEWDGPRTLHEMFDENMDEELRQFVPDYKPNLIVPKEIENFDVFKTTLGAVLNFIQVSDDKEKTRKLLREREIYAHLDTETVAAINTFADVKIKIGEMEDKIDMCKAWEDSMTDSRNEGLMIGREEGREEGQIRTLVALIKKNLIRLPQAADEMNLSVEDFKKLCRVYEFEV